LDKKKILLFILGFSMNRILTLVLCFFAMVGIAQSQTITTSSITGSPFWAGDPVSVPFTITGTYNAGNVFTAQLSDASGSFTTPTNIGSLTSQVAGTISATLPNTATGTDYRIRVVSSNPAVTGSDNSVNLTMRLRFTDVGTLGLQGLHQASSDWGDFDNDGDMDLIISGYYYSSTTSYYYTKIYRNNGNNTFTDIVAGIIGLASSKVQWGDYNNDGYLDFAICGSNGTYYTKIYKNNGNNTFTDINAGLVGVAYYGDISWNDYDSDGDLDLMVSGYTSSSATFSRLYRNNGDNTFSDSKISFPQIGRTSVIWGDYDNDGDQDLFMTGYDDNANVYIAKIYRNDGNSAFTDIGASISGLNYSSAAWGDYDNDGDLDLLVSGYNGTSPLYYTKVYNNNNGVFTAISASFKGLRDGSVAWIDFDNDGDLDIYVCGYDGTSYFSKIYKNNDNGVFADLNVSLVGAQYQHSNWGDYDNDGDLDFLTTYYNNVTKIYRNNADIANTVPTVPTNLSSQISGNDVNLAWNKSSDGQTSQNALSYNVRVGTASGGIQTVTPMANTSNGNRRIVRFGNTSLKNGAKLTGLPAGTYYYSAQSIDNAYAGSAFSTEGTFSTTIPCLVTPINLKIDLPLSPTLNWQNVAATKYNLQISTVSNFATVVYETDTISTNQLNVPASTLTYITKYYWRVRGEVSGSWTGWSLPWAFTTFGGVSCSVPSNSYFAGDSVKVTVTANGTFNSGNVFTAQLSDSTGSFAAPVNIGTLTGTSSGLIQGVIPGTASGSAYRIRVNSSNPVVTGSDNGSDIFIQQRFSLLASSLPALEKGVSLWGDYNNDGFQDIFICGLNGTTYTSKIFRNNGDDTFTDINAGITGVANNNPGGCAWVDYNNDGFLDLFISGYNSSTTVVSKLYKNNGDNTFTEMPMGFQSLGYSTAAWGDYNNDGYQDLYISGYTTSTSSTKIYRNNQDGTFTDIKTDIPNYGGNGSYISAAWADFDNDGDQDVVRVGGNSTADRIYKNNGDGTFTAVTGPAQLSQTAIAWGDYNSDGYLDFAETGYTSAPSTPSYIIKNNGNGTFTNFFTNFANASHGSMCWGDIDNDGMLDISLQGSQGSGNAKMYHYKYNTNNTFSNMNNSQDGYYYGTVSYNDYDNDGDLDILQNGRLNATAANIFSRILTNNVNTGNNPPSAPTNLIANVVGSTVTLSFNKSTDDKTPQNGLNYNVRVGSASGLSDVISPLADTSGIRKVTALGNANMKNGFVVKGLAPGTYYWSAQALDNNFAGSAFATEGTFTVTFPEIPKITYPTNTSIGIPKTVNVQWLNLNQDYQVQIANAATFAAANVVHLSGLIDTNNYSIPAGALANNIKYYWRVRSIKGTDSSDWSHYWSFTSDAGFGCSVAKTEFWDGDSINVNYTITGTFNSGNIFTAQLSDSTGSFATTTNIGTLTSTSSGTIKGKLPGFTGFRTTNDLYRIRVTSSNPAFTSSDNGEDITIKPRFNTVPAAYLTNFTKSAMAWADFDNDSLLDVVICGLVGTTKTTKIYKNLGNDSLVEIAAGLPGVQDGSVSLGDYNGDGWIDIFLSGAPASGKMANIYKNNGNNTFTNINAGLTGVDLSSSQWSDIDNDGDLDILYMGRTATANVELTAIYLNKGNDKFYYLNEGLPEASDGCLISYDFNNDSYFDIIHGGTVGTTTTWFNNGLYYGWSSNTNISSNSYLDLNAADYDKDGDLDVFQSVYYNSYYGAYTRIYKNNGNSTFTSSLNFNIVYSGTSCFGDYNHDGSIDLLYMGTGQSNIQMYDNYGNATFWNHNPSFTGVGYGSLSWVDYDNDGDLDFMLTGGTTQLVKNLLNNGNNPPSTPTNLSTTVNGAKVTFNWNKSTDDKTAQNSLSYNLRIGTAPGKEDIMASNAFLNTGQRKIYGYGNTNLKNSWIATELPAGTYYWSVQALDDNFAGSQFAEEGTFTKTTPILISPEPLTVNLTTTPLLTWQNIAATTYQVQISTTTDFAATVIDSTGFTQANITIPSERKLDNTTIFYWRVRAFIGADTTGWTQPWRFTTENPVITACTASVTTLSDGSYFDITYTITGNFLAGNVFTAQLSAAAGTFPTSPTAIGTSTSRVSGTIHARIPVGTDLGSTYRVRVVSSTPALTGPDNGVNITVNPRFQEVGSFTGYSSTSVIFADYDNDNDYDLLIGPQGYKNTNGSYASVSLGLNSAGSCNYNFGDYNNDGSLDILLIGSTYSKLYKNTNSVFTDIVPGFYSGFVTNTSNFVDYDNDGDLDVFFSGRNNSNSNTLALYRNDGTDFTSVVTGIKPLSYAKSAWGDYDNDGDMDLLMIGDTVSGSSGTRITKIFRNDNGIFIDTYIPLPKLESGSVAWGDYNQDGYLDILMTGDTASNKGATFIYKNNGNGTFTNINANIIGLLHSSVAWGDYDNDGDLDVLINGDDGTNRYSRLYRNDDSVFVDEAAGLFGLNNAAGSGVAFGDYDKDGDLDVMQIGGYVSGSSSYSASILYKNNLATKANTLPTPPPAIRSRVTKTTAYLSWDRGSDAETKQMGLTYNLYISKTQGKSDVMFSHADVTTGFRRTVEMGNAQQDTAWSIKNLSNGRYYWGVQSIDNSFAGSTFKEGIFNIAVPILTYPSNNLNNIAIRPVFDWVDVPDASFYRIQIATTDSFDLVSIVYDNANISDSSKFQVPVGTLQFYKDYYWHVSTIINGVEYEWSDVFKFQTQYQYSEIASNLTDIALGSVKFGDYDSDGDLDVLMTGWKTTNNYITKIFNNNNGTFTDINATFPGLYNSYADWNDYDNDGDLDFAVMGFDGTNRICKIYRNDGQNTFTDINATMTGLSSGMLMWNDIDNDGDYDLIVTGTNGTTPKTIIYKNTNGTFTEQVFTGLPDLYNGSIDFGDYDKDGKMDILLTGNDGTSKVADIYKNNGFFSFTAKNSGLPACDSSSAHFGDYNNDGKLDVVISGKNSAGTKFSKIFKNDNGVLTDINATLSAVSGGDNQWADYDNDGRLDLILSGSNFTKIYHNDGEYGFNVIESNLKNLDMSRICFGDFDNDTDLDFVQIGKLVNDYTTLLYINNEQWQNTAPSIPTNLFSSSTDSTITMTWHNSTDDKTDSTGLSYNIYFSTSAAAINKRSPMADLVTGKRYVVGFGNASQDTSITLRDIPQGRIYWSVQAIDNSFAGSAFAENGNVFVGHEVFIDSLSLLNEICINEPFQVNYTAHGTFEKTNKFKVQLSDATGNFTNAVDIGSLTKDSSGTVLASIPNIVNAGSGYKVRIVSTEPIVTSEPIPTTFTVKHPKITVTGVNKTDLCKYDKFNVSYTTQCLTFNNENIFSVELSDNNGLWSNPVVIGTLNAEKDSVIECQIPLSSIVSDKYKIRVKSSNEALIGDVWVSTLSVIDCINIILSSGWNMVSSYVKPVQPDLMPNVCSDAIDNLVIAKNNNGEVYIPSYNINNIGSWNVKQGYQVYVRNKDTIIIKGFSVIPENNPISLSSGWNIISYLRNSEMNCETAFASITDDNNLVIVKDNFGNVYIPSYGINTIGNLKPGQGYQIYVLNSDVLVYPGN
jgi:hypothetical protein